MWEGLPSRSIVGIVVANEDLRKESGVFNCGVLNDL